MGGALAVQALRSGEVEERLVEGEGFDDRGEAVHHRADRAAGLDVGGEAGVHDLGVGAEFQGLEHRHGGSHALDAGEVAGGGDDAAAAAADDDGAVAEGGVVALLDAREEGVAIHVGDGEAVQLGVVESARRAAGGAAAAAFELGQAVTAEGWHDRRISWGVRWGVEGVLKVEQGHKYL